MPKVTFNDHVIYKLLAIVVLGALIYLVYDILFLLFISYIFMSAISPLVSRISRQGVPRWLATLMVFIALLTVLVLFFFLTMPPLIQQTESFISVLPNFVRRSIVELNLEQYLREESLLSYLQSILQNFSRELTSVPVNLFRFGVGVFGGFLDLVMVFIFSFYLIVERESVHRFIAELFPSKDEKKFSALIDKVEDKLGAWLRGEFVLMTLIGLLVYLGLLLVGIPYAIPLAVIAGLLEIIPIIGPIVSAVPAILVGLAISPIKALTVVFLYILIQQLENSLVVPKVMKHAVGLDPLVVIIALMIGGRLAGPIGALLSVPASAVLIILYHERELDAT